MTLRRKDWILGLAGIAGFLLIAQPLGRSG